MVRNVIMLHILSVDASGSHLWDSNLIEFRVRTSKQLASFVGVCIAISKSNWSVDNSTKFLRKDWNTQICTMNNDEHALRS